MNLPTYPVRQTNRRDEERRIGELGWHYSTVSTRRTLVEFTTGLLRSARGSGRDGTPTTAQVQHRTRRPEASLLIPPQLQPAQNHPSENLYSVGTTRQRRNRMNVRLGLLERTTASNTFTLLLACPKFLVWINTTTANTWTLTLYLCIKVLLPTSATCQYITGWQLIHISTVQHIYGFIELVIHKFRQS
jgi:hypothetical protein